MESKFMKPDMDKKTKARDRRYRAKYNITLDEYKAILEAQGGLCAICRKPQIAFKLPFHVDHDHSTHLVRGLLCWPCNSMIPRRRNTIELIRRMLVYLVFPSAESVIGKRLTPGKPPVQYDR